MLNTVALAAAAVASFGVPVPESSTWSENTPPRHNNATPHVGLAYSTGIVSSREMLRTGAVLALAGAILLLLGYRIMLPLAFGSGVN